MLLLLVWAALLIGGLGLIFWANRANFAPRFQSPGDAVYAAGTAFTTLGVSGEVTGAFTRLMVLTCSI